MAKSTPARQPSPWLNTGALRTRFRQEQGHLVRETVQPGHREILEQNQIERNLPKQRFLGGWKVASIPVNDLAEVYALYPELAMDASECDKQMYERAVVRFTNDPLMAKYVIKRA